MQRSHGNLLSVIAVLLGVLVSCNRSSGVDGDDTADTTTSTAEDTVDSSTTTLTDTAGTATTDATDSVDSVTVAVNDTADTDTVVVDTETVDPAVACALPRERLAGSCSMASGDCQEEYSAGDGSDTDVFVVNCQDRSDGIWRDEPCAPPEGEILVGICRGLNQSTGEVYRSYWYSTPYFIPASIAQQNDSLAGDCRFLFFEDDAWCSIEDGSHIELDCSRAPAAGICDMQSENSQCHEFTDTAEAESMCASVESGFSTEANCPTEGLVGWCNHASADVFYYEEDDVTDDVIASCNKGGGWCTP
ncbi:MAG: hypothetical protein JXX14_01395 [Deltaproteobacteria bacterium]|nr:hypothetical protein [Deltaproteobacteria bacterium]